MAKDHQFSNETTPRNSSHRESAEDYRGTLYRDGSWRVAICRDQIQFLVQRQRPGKAGAGGGWDSRRFCVTKAALIRDWHALTGNLGLVLIDLLPERASMVGIQSAQPADRRLYPAGHA